MTCCAIAPRSSVSYRSLPWLLTGLLLLTGCSRPVELAATEVLNEANCKGAEDGLQLVSYSEVAAMRGSTLLGMTVAAEDKESDLLLLSLSKGQQPTAGYHFELRDALLDEQTATLLVHWQQPAADSALAQIITFPCLVIGLESGTYTRIVARDQNDELLGEVQL
ncbi:MAG: protease complex subunit PrcB family protein [Pseudomonadales bacterium]|nr:protease complex subunit PrcB family protein [Pseudomonadales bacterium]